jgi:DNA repair exonuclease SbcCD ATPase subunit
LNNGTTLLVITIRNFLSIGNITQTIYLSRHGLTLVLGENIDVGGANSRNGCGKTSVLQAISYVLFGEPLTKIKLDNCVNNINDKAMLVTMDFEVNGTPYRIERGRKPNILKFFIDGQLNEAKGVNRNTQEDIEKVLGMSHMMFKHVVALNTYTLPFMRLDAAKQREVIEELLGITQLSTRASSLKDIMDITKEQLRDEESAIKANGEANARIEQAIERARADSQNWQLAQDRRIDDLMAQAETMSLIDIDSELLIFDQMDAWSIKKKEIDDLLRYARQEVDSCASETARLSKDIKRYQDEATRVDSGEIARLEAQAKRYLMEAEEVITVQLNRLLSEASRRREEAEIKLARTEKVAVEIKLVQQQIDNPNAHTCSTCGQGLIGTDHLGKVMHRLGVQMAELSSQADKAVLESGVCIKEAEAIDLEITQTKERHAAKQSDARTKAAAIQAEIVVARTTVAEQNEIAARRVIELGEMVTASLVRRATSDAIVDEGLLALAALGIRPVSVYPNRDAIIAIKRERDLLLNTIEVEIGKPNVHLSKIEGLVSTLVTIDYDPVNAFSSKLKHEMFLYKLLTAKDSFIRKRIVDQNLLYLNKRLNFYLEKIGLPHEVKFVADLTVDIALLGRELDFEQLSGGEKNRVVLATFWAFRDVWESSNTSLNLLFADEVIDNCTDDSGAEAAFLLLQTMARDRHKNVFLISHKESLIAQADHVMLARKEDQFTTFIEDYQMA